MEQKLCRGCEEPVIDKVPGCPLQCGTVQCPSYKKKPIYDYEVLPIIWVMGGPGSGKRTQCQWIVATYGLTYLSPGDIVRKELASGSDRSRCLNSVTGRGGLVPNDIVLALLKDAIENAAAKGARGFVINGFPREKTQGPVFERAVGRVSTSIKTLFHRMRQRPKDPKRTDETPIAIKLRLETYMKHYESIVGLYNDRIVKINAEQSAELAFKEIRIPMDELMKNVTALKAAKESAQTENVNEQPSMPKDGSKSPPGQKTGQPSMPMDGTKSPPGQKTETNK